MKNARRKLEVPMPAAMPCKTPANCSGENRSSIGIRKTKYACIVDADESMRIRLEGVPQRWPGRWGPQGVPFTGGGRPARVPNLHVCKSPAVVPSGRYLQ